MSYLPIVLDLRDKKILIVGGGKIASNKLERLLNFTKEIRVISKDFSPRVVELIRDNCLSTLPRAYQSGDIDGFDIVVVATDDILLQKKIFEEAKEKRVLVNSVDSQEYCSFILPSVIKRGDFLLSFSTSGASPALSKHLKRYFEAIIPESIDEFLKKMRKLRSELPKGESRMRKFDKMAREFIQKSFKG